MINKAIRAYTTPHTRPPNIVSSNYFVSKMINLMTNLLFWQIKPFKVFPSLPSNILIRSPIRATSNLSTKITHSLYSNKSPTYQKFLVGREEVGVKKPGEDLRGHLAHLHPVVAEGFENHLSNLIRCATFQEREHIVEDEHLEEGECSHARPPPSWEGAKEWVGTISLALNPL